MHCTDIYPRGRGRPDIILFTLAKSIRCYTYKRIQNGNLTSQSSTTKNPDRKTDSATMVFTGYLIPFLTLSTQALASYTGNLNYRSPSLRYARLGIDLEKVTARSFSKRDEAPYPPSQLNFTHGVASGDPYADSVILWTRVAPSMQSDESDVTVSGDVPLYNHETERFVRASAHPVCVKYRVFDEERNKVVDQGTAWTSSDIDYTVKVYHIAGSRETISPTANLDNGNRLKPKDLIRSPLTTTSLTSVTPMLRVPLGGPRPLPLRMETRKRSSSRFILAASGVRKPTHCCIYCLKLNVDSEWIFQRLWKRREKGQR